MWLKMDNSFFEMNNDIYICNCYIPPENSKLLKENCISPFEDLRTELENFGAKGNLIIMGDFNSRTVSIQESLHIDKDITYPTFNRSEMTSETYIPLRINEDKTVDKFGKLLIDTIEEAHMLILNGRTLGDCDGKHLPQVQWQFNSRLHDCFGKYY